VEEIVLKRLLCFVVLMVVVFSAALGYNSLRHFVQNGESLEGISREYEVKPSVVMDWNPDLAPDSLNVGEVLQIPFPVGYKYKVNRHDTVSAIADFFFAGTKSLAVANSMAYPYTVKTGDILFIPEYCIGETFNEVSSKLLWPAYGVITSPYGYRKHPVTGEANSFHTGIDIARDAPALKKNTPFGAPVFAAASGVVTFAGENGGYGNMIEIKGSEQIYRYAHLTRFDCYEGQRVERGDIIGRMGNTGRSTGQHLHFEVRSLDNSKTLDPMKFLPPVSEMKQ